MRISLTDAGKRFNRDWIFRHFTYTFETGQSYAIIGPNGSGKSTLLQTLGGSMMLNEGKISYELRGTKYEVENIFNEVSICAPYLELVEEMTLDEFLRFHKVFKPFINGIDPQHIITVIGLENAIHKQIRYYSSGMKQRVKLAQAIFSNTSIVLLDEPCTNFDAAGVDLYHQLIDGYCRDRLVIVSSNDEAEYRHCAKRINMAGIKSE